MLRNPGSFELMTLMMTTGKEVTTSGKEQR